MQCREGAPEVGRFGWHLANSMWACLCLCALQVRWLARLSDPAVRFVDKIIGEAVVSAAMLRTAAALAC